MSGLCSMIMRICASIASQANQCQLLWFAVGSGLLVIACALSHNIYSDVTRDCGLGHAVEMAPSTLGRVRAGSKTSAHVC